MSDEPERAPLRMQQQEAVRRKGEEFQEAPGEAEADAVRDAFLQSAGPGPADVASALGRAEEPTQVRALSRLQRERGNAYVQRVVAEARGTPGRLVGSSQPEMVAEVLQRKGAGSALPGDARAQMEGVFGSDLGAVRVHADGEAAALNRELDSQAFTVGSDVFFAEGKYDPTSGEGQGLLAHELTHVGQQTGFLQREANPDEEEEVQRQAAPEEEEEEPKTV